ncbi:MAG: phage holin family protein [Bacteroidota bacterium]|nr:phage holin family protein [Bacteroidota bacterium]
MNYILNLLVNAAVVMLMAYILPQVRVKSFGTALWVAFLVGLLNSTLGFLIRFPLNLVTFFLLSFLVHLIVTAIIIKVVDKLVRNFEIRGFWPALVIAIAIGIANTLFERKEAEKRYDDYQTATTQRNII